MTDPVVERALGRIEGTQAQILDALKTLTTSFTEHKAEDVRNFSAVRALSFDHREELKDFVETRFDAQAIAGRQHLDAQDLKLDGLKSAQDKAKGAGWVILGLLTSLATFVGGAVIAVFAGWVKIH